MLKTTGEFANPLFSFFLSTKIIKALTNNFQHKTQNTFHLCITSKHFFNKNTKNTS
jgi:hypothetical protein